MLSSKAGSQRRRAAARLSPAACGRAPRAPGHPGELQGVGNAFFAVGGWCFRGGSTLIGLLKHAGPSL